MKTQELYTPDWISEADACKWLGINKVTLFRWRSSKGLAWTNINGKTVCYDKKQIVELLNKNSSYQFSGDKILQNTTL